MTHYHEGDVRKKRPKAKRREAETHPYANLAGLWDTRWTPNTEEVRDLVQVAINEAGSVRILAEAVGIRQRHLRRILHGHTKALSYTVADRLLARSSVAWQLTELPWHTAAEIQAMGIWAPQFGKDPTQK